MRVGTSRVCTILLAALLISILLAAQAGVRSLVISGTSGSVPVTRVNGRNLVDVESLAQLVNGALSYKGNQITMTLGAPKVPAPPAQASRAAEHGFSKDFLRAGIEAMSTIREWHSALANSIENGYPMTSESLAPFEEQALKNLRFAQAAATTDSDRKLAQLAGSAFQKMKGLSDKYVTRRENLNYSAPDSLQNDPENESLVACGRALGAMAANGQITDEAACH